MPGVDSVLVGYTIGRCTIQIVRRTFRLFFFCISVAIFCTDFVVIHQFFVPESFAFCCSGFLCSNQEAKYIPGA